MPAGGHGADEFQEFFGGTGREPVIRLGHEVGVDLTRQVELDRHAPGAGQRVTVGHGGDAGEVGEPNHDRHRGALEVGSTADGSRGRGWMKGSLADDVFRMHGPVAGVNPEQGMQRVHELLVEALFRWREITGRSSHPITPFLATTSASTWRCGQVRCRSKSSRGLPACPPGAPACSSDAWPASPDTTR
jgi:hypothetical protein